MNPGRTRNRWQQKVNGERHQLSRWVLRRLGLSRFPLLAVLSMRVLGGEMQQVGCLGHLLDLGQSIDQVPGVPRGQFTVFAPLER